jgi:hypothetical protein
MKIKKSVLLKLVKEETLKRLDKLVKEDSAAVIDADSDNKDKDKKKKQEKPKDKSPKPKEKSSKEPPKPEKDQELPGVSPEQDAEADANGKGIGDQIAGMTILSFTMEPRSKVVPGAIELNLQFKESPQPLRVLISKSGQVRFLYKGSLQSELGTNPVPESPAAADNQGVPTPGVDDVEVQ